MPVRREPASRYRRTRRCPRQAAAVPARHRAGLRPGPLSTVTAPACAAATARTSYVPPRTRRARTCRASGPLSSLPRLVSSAYPRMDARGEGRTQLMAGVRDELPDPSRALLAAVRELRGDRAAGCGPCWTNSDCVDIGLPSPPGSNWSTTDFGGRPPASLPRSGSRQAARTGGNGARRWSPCRSSSTPPRSARRKRRPAASAASAAVGACFLGCRRPLMTPRA